MAIKVSQRSWNDETFRSAILGVAEILQEDIEIKRPKETFKPYNVQIWLNDNIVFSKDFLRKSQAKKYMKRVLSMKKCKDAYADLKKYNKKKDDFDWWFFKLENDKLVEIEEVK